MCDEEQISDNNTESNVTNIDIDDELMSEENMCPDDANIDHVETFNETVDSGVNIEQSEVATALININGRYRSVGTQTCVCPEDIDVGQHTDNEKRLEDESLPPSSNGETRCSIDINESSGSCESTGEEDCSSDYEPTGSFATDENSEVCESTDEEHRLLDPEDTDHLMKMRFHTTRCLLRKHPKLYMGVPSDLFYLIDSISKRIVLKKKKLTAEDIVMFVFRKLRRSEPFGTLAIDFGIGASHASRLFTKYLPVISNLLKQLVVWPSEKSVRRNLPVAFRANYRNVVSIIDCFEIEIEKPENPKWQSLTWSQYKKTNTIKYLVSITPNGIINFISKGYGGRISDLDITRKSGYLDNLQDGNMVMGDRGFKTINPLLLDRNCTLVTPASVFDGKNSSVEQVTTSRKIASLRIHVERAIRRIREYEFLAPHSRVDLSLVPLLDDAVIVASALCNLQPALIR